MPTIIDTSYFKGDLQIAQLAQQAVSAKATKYIDTYEPELLEKALGYELCKAFTDGLTADPADARWVALRDGAEYTDRNGDLTKWDGFKNAKKLSPIANYVYYHILCNDATWTTGSGEVTPNNENAKRESPTTKISAAWNNMVNMLCRMRGYLDANKVLYPEWKGWRLSQESYFRKINDFGI